MSHECEPPVDGAIQHRWTCHCGRIWEVVEFDERNGNSMYAAEERDEQE